ncbi:MAG: nucleoside-diphosphate kinase [Lentisphaeria bacterium]|nr:nucleoside-diphosphate kinase [Lentisphaeria bacterium]
MKHRLAYVLITPHTVRKSRTGAVISRLLSGTTGTLVGAQVVGLDEEMTEKFCAAIKPGKNELDRKYRMMIRDYVRKHMSPAADGRKHRALLLVFCGDNIQQEIEAVTGHFITADSGETIRGAFGDEVRYDDGSLQYFEPAVLYSEPGEEGLDIWEDFIQRSPNLIEGTVNYPCPERVQRTLVLIKPDSFRHRSVRPGAVVDLFSRTGLRIIGCKLVRMTVAQALEFYGPVKDILAQKLAPSIGEQAKVCLETELGFRLPPTVATTLAETVGVPYAHEQFERIVHFMSGRRPGDTPVEDMNKPGLVGCLAVVYEGEDAVEKIRNVLGPTDPTKAPGGTVRGEFGHNVMINTAHASDSPENAAREMAILKLDQSNLIQQTLAHARNEL